MMNNQDIRKRVIAYLSAVIIRFSNALPLVAMGSPEVNEIVLTKSDIQKYNAQPTHVQKGPDNKGEMHIQATSKR